MVNAISTIDIIVLGIFLLVTFLIGILDRKRITLEDYWVNSRKTNKYILVATVTSTFVGVGALLSNAAITYSGGGFGTIFFLSSFLFYFWIFAKFFTQKIKEFGDSNKAYTIPDFLEFRYSKKVRVVALIVNLLTYTLWLSLQILGIGIFVSVIGGFDPGLSTLIGGGIVILYTSIGGLKADIRTDAFQFIVMLFLIFMFLPITVFSGGGVHAIFNLPTSFLSGQEFAPLPLYLFAFLFLGASTLVSSEIWQRVYASDSPANARQAMRISGVIIFIFLIAAVFFGVYAKILLPDISPNAVIPELLKLLLPPFLFGIVLSAFFAAIMSSADTMLLVVSMTLVNDLYQKTLGKNLSADKALKISRLTTLIVGMIALSAALIIFNVIHLAIEAVSFSVVLLPAVIFGFYWKKANSRAAFWSILLGLVAVILFLSIAPLYAFIPGIIISFLSFLVITWITEYKERIEKNKVGLISDAIPPNHYD